MNLTILEIIKLLEKQGHDIEYTHRKDGGYIIRKVDGVRYTGKTGNAFVRRMVGATLSQARQVQLAKIRLPKGKKAEKLEEIPVDVKKALRKVQREWRKKHPTIEGTMTTRGVRYHLRHYGEKETLLSLDKGYRYAQGLAYIDNVNFLLERIRQDLDKQPNSAMEEVYNLIKMHTLEMKEEWLQPLHYDCLQPWENGIISGEECAYMMKAIMNF